MQSLYTEYVSLYIYKLCFKNCYVKSHITFYINWPYSSNIIIMWK